MLQCVHLNKSESAVDHKDATISYENRTVIKILL